MPPRGPYDYRRKKAQQDLVMEVNCFAPQDRVFAAWTDGRRLKRWIGGAEGVVTPHFDALQLGDSWSVRVRKNRRRARSWYGGVVHIFEPPTRLCFSIAGKDLVNIASPTIVTVLFRAVEGRTQIEVRQMGFHSESERRAYRAIWASALPALQTFVTRNADTQTSFANQCRNLWNNLRDRFDDDDMAMG